MWVGVAHRKTARIGILCTISHPSCLNPTRLNKRKGKPVPKVSVLMPVYNTREEYLRPAIESILNQTFTDFEFIIINDGSTKEAPAQIIKSYKDKRIKYYKNSKNRGLIYTRNRLMSLATGEFIAWMDSDDISLPHRLDTQLRYFINHPDVSIVGSWVRIFPTPDKGGHQKENIGVLDVLRGWPLNNPTVMWRRADIEKYDLKYDDKFPVAEDYDFWSRAVRVLKIANVQEELLMYRRMGQNISVSRAEQMEKLDKQIKQSLLDFLTDDVRVQQDIMKLIKKNPRKKLFYKEILPNKQRNIWVLGVRLFSYKTPKQLYKKLKKVEREFPKVYSCLETVEKLISGASICRYGDGEFTVMRGGGIYYQNANPVLAKRLAEILSVQSTDKLLVAITGFQAMPSIDTPIHFWHRYWANGWAKLKSYFKRDEYYNSFVSRASVFFTVPVEKIRQIWASRDVVFVVGRGSRFVMEPRLFDNIRSHNFIYVEPQNAFNEYDKILKACAEYSKDTLFFISAGPTATVLAYDLANLGYQALDLGHLPNCYAEYLNEAPSPENTPFVNKGN
ncbi:MAG: DUF1792 domain-containing protein [Alphaproteobacteria bacterium]|nr:DUF1792 domain-containing protein [Alphaproteobacteria bacterium]